MPSQADAARHDRISRVLALTVVGLVTILALAPPSVAAVLECAAANEHNGATAKAAISERPRAHVPDAIATLGRFTRAILSPGSRAPSRIARDFLFLV